VFWTFPTPTGVVQSVTLGDYDTLWVGSNDGVVYALDKRSGSVVWSFAMGGWVWGAPTLSMSGGTVYVASTDWTVVALEYQTGAVQWRSAPLGGELWGTPAVTHWGILRTNIVVVGSLDGGVYGLDAADGKLLWREPYFTGGPITATPALSGDGTVVYVASSDTRLYSIETTTGLVKRFADSGLPIVRDTNGPLTSSPRVNPVTGDVVVGSWDGSVYSFPTPPSDGNANADPAVAAAAVAAGATGGVRSFAMGGPVSSSPVFNATTGAVLIGSDDGFVHILNPYTLLPAQQPLYVGSRVPAPPTLGRGSRLYVSAGVGSLVAFG